MDTPNENHNSSSGRDRLKLEFLQRIDAQLAEAIDAAKGASVEQQRELLKHFGKIETGLGAILEHLTALDRQLDQQAEVEGSDS